MPDCLVCTTPDAEGSGHGLRDAFRIDCKRCGGFDLSGTAHAMLSNQLSKGIHRRALMSHSLRRMSAQISPPPVVHSNMFDSFWPTDRLPTPQKQADDLILIFGDNQPSPDTTSNFTAYFLDAWIGAAIAVHPQSPHTGLHWVAQYLVESRLLTFSMDTPEPSQRISARLSMLGWEKYEQLKKVRTESRTAFMAMKFGDAQLDKVVDDIFKPAVARTGFELRKLTDGQPAGLIDDQIRASILSGRFVVAHLTHGSYGAYWEAGFAEGLNLPVIYTCEKTAWQAKATHFDTNHMLTIIWDPADLSKAGEALTATIRATLRTEAKQQD